MKIVFTALLTLLVLSSCNNAYSTNIETEAQTDKKFVGNWRIINDPNDSRTFHLTKVITNAYRFDGMVLDMGFYKQDDNTLIVTDDRDGSVSFELKYHPENDHITVTVLPSKDETKEFVRVN